MELSKQGLELIKEWEGIKDGDRKTPGFDPYPDMGGIWTIGYGHAMKNKYGKFLRGPEGKREAYAQFPGGISQADADAMLLADVKIFSDRLAALHIAGTQAQVDALISFAFNVGLGAQSDPRSGGLLNSTLLKMHRAGGPILAGEMSQIAAGKLAIKSQKHAPIANLAEAFCAWSNVGKTWSKGLFRRRLCEYMIYRGEDLGKAVAVSRSFGT